MRIPFNAFFHHGMLPYLTMACLLFTAMKGVAQDGEVLNVPIPEVLTEINIPDEPKNPTVTAIVGARLIDGLGGPVVENAVVLIEWPEHAGALLPPPDLDIKLDYADTGRRAKLTAHSEKGKLWLTTLALAPQQSLRQAPRDADS